MFSLTEDFAKAQYDYTRERLGAGQPRTFADDSPARRRTGLFTLLFTRHLVRRPVADC